MASAHAFHAFQRNAQTKAFHTPTMLNRWSVADKTLPPAEDIKEIHVYDFDNTLFNSPTPNRSIWAPGTVGAFQSPNFVSSGGWWHDARILAATGSGEDIESKRAWAGCWNEKVVELIQLSVEQPDALTVLLTGRQEKGFAPLIKKMVASKGLDFDLIILKPETGPQGDKIGLVMDTMKYKQMFLVDLIETYKHAQEIRVYEDRSKHVDGFRNFFLDYNKKQNGVGGIPTRGPITAEVVLVTEGAALLNPVTEVAEIQRLLDDHNTKLGEKQKDNHLKIVKNVLYTGYMINAADSEKLRSLVPIPDAANLRDYTFRAENVMICFGSANKTVLEKAGGMGYKVLFQATAFGSHSEAGNTVYACKVQPVTAGTKVHTDSPTMAVILAMKGRGAKPHYMNRISNWQTLPLEKQFIFEAVVGEKAVLRVEQEVMPDEANHYTSRKRKDHDFDSVPTGPGHRGNFRGDGRGDFRGGRDNRKGGYPSGPRNQNTGGRGGFADRGRGGFANRGKGRHYSSLDDPGNNGAGSIPYDDDYTNQSGQYQRRQGNDRQSGYDFYQPGNHRGGGGGRGRGRGGYGGGHGGGGGGGGGNGGQKVSDFY